MSFFPVASSGLGEYRLDNGWDNEYSEDSEEDADETEFDKLMRRRRKKSENKDEEGRPRRVIFSFEYPEENIDAKEAIRRRELANGDVDVSNLKPGDVVKYASKGKRHKGIILAETNYQHDSGFILYTLDGLKIVRVNRYYLSNALYLRSLGHPVTEDNLRRFIFNETDKEDMNRRQKDAFLKEVREMRFEQIVRNLLRNIDA